MERTTISVDRFAPRAHALWGQQWLLLSAGDFAAGKYNAMTVAWGSIGYIWERPFVQILVRPHRYTFEFLERYDTFTLCAFPAAQRRALQILGARSGRDGDKLAESGLTPQAAQRVAAPVYAEAELAIECRKLYWQDLNPAGFLEGDIAKLYARQDYHRVYFGEVLQVSATDAYAVQDV